MRFRLDSESRAKGVAGNHNFHFSHSFEDGGVLVCLGGFDEKVSVDAIRYFAVELEHWVYEKAEADWSETSAPEVLAELAQEADGMLSEALGRGNGKCSFFAAVMQSGKIDYLSLGDSGAVIWDASEAAAGSDSESSLRIRQLGLSRRRGRALPLEDGRGVSSSDVGTSVLAPGMAAAFFTKGSYPGGGKGDEIDPARLAAVIDKVYGEEKRPSRRLLREMLGQWDRNADFTGVVIDALPDGGEWSEARILVGRAGEAALQIERFRQEIRELTKRLEAEIARFEAGMDSALEQGREGGSGEVPDMSALRREISEITASAEKTIKDVSRQFEAKTRESAAVFSLIISKLNRERKGIDVLESRLEDLVERGLVRLNRKQGGKSDDRRRLFYAALFTCLLLLFLVAGAGLGVYGYRFFDSMRSGEEKAQVAETETSGSPSYAGKVRPASVDPDDAGMVWLRVDGAERSVPVPDEIFRRNSSGDSAMVGMEKTYELILKTLRSGGYDRRHAKEAISFLLQAREMDADKRLELLNFMAFNYLFAEEGIANYEDRSWAINVFVERFPLDEFDNQGHVGGEPGMFQVRLDDRTFEKLAEWKQGTAASAEEAVPIILQFMFVYAGEGGEPATVDGKWGHDSRRMWRNYVRKLRGKVKGAGDWEGKDPMEPLR